MERGAKSPLGMRILHAYVPPTLIEITFGSRLSNSRAEP